jgi:hypothetical protein
MMSKKVLTHKLSEPLNGVTTAMIDIHAGDGNLTIGQLTSGEQMLASGTLQYLVDQSLPSRDLVLSNGQATLTLRGGADRRPRFRLPWSACNAGTDWQIQLNPAVSSDITAHSDGGNLKLDLAGMVVTRLSAETGGGNIDVDLPDSMADLSVTARTGAGNVSIRIPSDAAALIHTSTGLGKTIVDPRFYKIDKDTYQSSEFDRAAKKVEITLQRGAGNVMVNSG